MEKNKRGFTVTASAAVLIVNGKGELLLVKQAGSNGKGLWGPPAGSMEAYENPKRTAIREAQEEIGVTVEIIDQVGIYPVFKNKSTGLGFVFRAWIPEGEISISEDEISEYRYFSKEEIEELIEIGLLYKPEYNTRCITDFFSGVSYRICIRNL